MLTIHFDPFRDHPYFRNALRHAHLWKSHQRKLVVQGTCTTCKKDATCVRIQVVVQLALLNTRYNVGISVFEAE